MLTPILQCALGGLIGLASLVCFLMAPEKKEAPEPCQFVSVEDYEGRRGFIRLAISKLETLKAHLTVPGKYLQGVR